ncbi:MAG: hypothetical protein KGI69_03535 [Patescibacteria group bacterium]|nr:hypothetical protein [Patescibacteria group bacterium]
MTTTNAGSDNNKYPLLAAGLLLAVAVAIGATSLYQGSHPAARPSADASKPASLALLDAGNVAAVGALQHIRWSSQNYAAPTVSIDLIRKVSDQPAKYVLVRQIASSAANNGDFAWTPEASDAGPGTYIQIACAQSSQACTASPLPPSPVSIGE